MAQDNGGAIAQKGFNFQNHVISLVAIRNYKKKDFAIYVESDDDFEITYENNYHAYIQVKGEKRVSLTSLLTRIGDKPSIFEKHFSLGNDDSIYKIVVFNFSQKDLNSMQEDTEDELFENSRRLSTKQEEDIIIKLGESFKKRVGNFSLVKTAFSNNFSDARKYLKGELVTQKITVDGRDDLILDELDRLIRQKSEYIVKTDYDRKRKKITSNELDPILKKLTSKARFESELEKFSFPTFRNENIKKEEMKIIVEYMSIKLDIIKVLKDDINRLNTKQLTEIVPEIIDCCSLNQLEENTKYAIIISAYCDILEGVADE